MRLLLSVHGQGDCGFVPMPIGVTCGAGASLHGVAQEGSPMQGIAKTIGEGPGVPVRSVAEEVAPGHFDRLALLAAGDIPMTRGFQNAARSAAFEN